MQAMNDSLINHSCNHQAWQSGLMCSTIPRPPNGAKVTSTKASGSAANGINDEPCSISNEVGNEAGFHSVLLVSTWRMPSLCVWVFDTNQRRRGLKGHYRDSGGWNTHNTHITTFIPWTPGNVIFHARSLRTLELHGLLTTGMKSFPSCVTL